MTYNDIVKWWQKNTLNTYDDYAQVLDNFRILFACNSSNIEGAHLSYHSTRDIFDNNPVTNVIPSEVVEIQNQKYVFQGVIKALLQRRPITTDFILAVHNRLLQGIYDETRWNKGERPGKFKVHDYCVGINDVGTEPEYVKDELTELLEELDEAKTNPLVASVYFHAKFECIHPFADGNGRVGRMLMNYLLMLYNYPPTVIFNEDKETYYLALEIYSRSEELSGFIKFVQEQTIKTWENKIYRVKHRRSLRDLVPDIYKNLSDKELNSKFGHLM